MKHADITTCHDLVKIIKNFHKTTGMSYWKLAEESGLHRNTLRNIEDKDWNPRIDTIDAVIGYICKRSDVTLQ